MRDADATHRAIRCETWLMRTYKLSLLDLAAVGKNETIGESFAGSVALAQLAERSGYERVWYAEHHNIGSIASSATAVLIAHVGAHTSTIRLGSGGVMLPNHSPLAIAEQFGTLAELHPGRIDLGLGRAPGTDQNTWRAMRRDPAASEQFPQDVLELQGFLSDESPVPGVKAIPGQGTHVPLYILGSSLFGAQLAAVFGLPFGFASHFAPRSLQPPSWPAERFARPLRTPAASSGRRLANAGPRGEDLLQRRKTLPVGDGRRFTGLRHVRRDLALLVDVTAAVGEHADHADHEYRFGFDERRGRCRVGAHLAVTVHAHPPWSLVVDE